MLGYITESEAKEMGFTHHGKCFGIPIWIIVEDVPMVATKWAPMELLFSVAQMIEAGIQIFFDMERGFQFEIGRPIE